LIFSRISVLLRKQKQQETTKMAEEMAEKTPLTTIVQMNFGLEHRPHPMTGDSAALLLELASTQVTLEEYSLRDPGNTHCPGLIAPKPQEP